MSRSRKISCSLSLFPGKVAGIFVFMLGVSLVGCAVAPTAPTAPTLDYEIALAPEKTKNLLEKIQGAHPRYTIRALLAPEGTGTTVHLAVYTTRSVHEVVRGFQEPFPHKKLYPDCNHWFNVTRNFDPACGGGPYIGTANLLFADGMALGLIFDLYQAGRYPFTYTRTAMPDKKATRIVLDELLSAAKGAEISSGQKIRISER